MRTFLLACAVFALGTASIAFSQDKAPQPASPARSPESNPATTQKQRLVEMLTQVKLVGQFTIVGRESGRLSKEEYIIQKVEKLDEGDKWMFHCRIKYADHDVAIPLPIDVKWAGDTPVITLDDLTIPGLGTFSSRVVLHESKYAGTWRHDKVGGHLFGTIEKLSPAEATDSAPAK